MVERAPAARARVRARACEKTVAVAVAVGLASGLCTVAACGPGLLDLDEASDGTGASTGASSGSASAEGPQPGQDQPSPAASCEAEGGRFVQVGGPWRIEEQLIHETAGFGVLPGETELLALWEGQFSGVAPNALGARVGYDGQVVAQLGAVWERTITRPPSIHRAAEGYVVTYCGLHGAVSKLTSQILDATGSPLVNEQLRNDTLACSGSRPDGLWTGERYLFAWNGGNPAQVLLDVGEPTQSVSEGFVELAPSGNVSCPPRMALGVDVVMLVAGIDYDKIYAFSLTHHGQVLDSQLLAVPPDVPIGQVAVGAAADGSFSVFMAGRAEQSLYHTRIDAQGLGSPMTLVEGVDERIIEMQLLHRPGGFLLVAGVADDDGGSVRTIATDDQGQVLSYEALATDDAPAFQGRPAAAMVDEDAWVVYMAGQPDATYDIRLAQLSCVR